MSNTEVRHKFSAGDTCWRVSYSCEDMTLDCLIERVLVMDVNPEGSYCAGSPRSVISDSGKKMWFSGGTGYFVPEEAAARAYVHAQLTDEIKWAEEWLQELKDKQKEYAP